MITKKLRSLIFIPCGNMKFIDKINNMDYKPDAVILDLEDSVSDNSKNYARNALSESVSKLSSFHVMVRVNSFQSPNFKLDIKHAMIDNVDAILIPKVNSSEIITKVSNIVIKLERERGLNDKSTLLIPMIESAQGIVSLNEISKSSDRVFALAFGSGDYALDMGLRWTKETVGHMFPRMLIPVIAKANGLHSIDSVFMDLDNIDTFRSDSEISKSLGYNGRMVVHPNQIRVTNETYVNSQDDIVWAKKILHAYESLDNVGAIKVDGYLVDKVHYKLAKKIMSEYSTE